MAYPGCSECGRAAASAPLSASALVALFASLFLPACLGQACTRNSDCKWTQVCVDAYCIEQVDGTTATGSPAADSDADAGAEQSTDAVLGGVQEAIQHGMPASAFDVDGGANTEEDWSADAGSASQGFDAGIP